MKKQSKLARRIEGQKVMSENESVLISRIAKQSGLDEHGSGVYIAICAALEYGSWNRKVVTSALLKCNILAKFTKIESILIHEDVLIKKYVKETPSVVFTDTFLFSANNIVKLSIENAPAKMLPLESADPWIVGERSMLNLNIIPGSKEIVPELALYAVNKLQAVQFRVSEELLVFLDNRLDEVRLKSAKLKHPSKTIHRQLAIQQVQSDLLHEYHSIGAVSFQITMDYRGRMYYRGGLMTPQGHDFQKAAWQFANPVALGTSGKAALAIHFANVYGKDKCSMTERIAWAKQYGYGVAEGVAAGRFPKNADKPYQTIVAANEWQKLRDWEAGGNKTSDFMSTLVCHTDGTCNGYQHASAITKCNITAKSVNCTAGTRDDIPEDVYRLASEALVRILTKAGYQEQAEIVHKYGRKALKYSVMTGGYGAGKGTLVRVMLAEMDEEDVLIMEEISDDVLQKLVLSAITEVASAVMALNKALQDAVGIQQKRSPSPIKWQTSDGFMVIQESRTKDDEIKKYVGRGKWTTRSDTVDASAQQTSIGANYIHSYDAQHLRSTVLHCSFDLVTVHDSIGSHAGNYFSLYRVVREQFVTTHSYDQIASLNYLNDLNICLPILGNYSPTEVINSPYFFS